MHVQMFQFTIRENQSLKTEYRNTYKQNQQSTLQGKTKQTIKK